MVFEIKGGEKGSGEKMERRESSGVKKECCSHHSEQAAASTSTSLTAGGHMYSFTLPKMDMPDHQGAMATLECAH